MDTISKHQSMTIASVRSEQKPRRYYRREQKLRIVEETLVPGASVSVIARKHDVNANVVFAWRRQHKRGQLGPTAGKSQPALLPILVGTNLESTDRQHTSSSSTGHLEIHLPDGRWIHVSGSVDAATLKVALAELTRS